MEEKERKENSKIMKNELKNNTDAEVEKEEELEEESVLKKASPLQSHKDID